MQQDNRLVWLNRERLIAWSAAFLVVEAGALALLMLQQRGIIAPVGPSSIDFVSFYAAGKLALAGTPALAYDQPAHYLAEQQATAFGTPYVFFFYPPVFLMVCAALATLPYLLAYAVWQAATLAAFLLLLRRVLNASGWGWVIPVLAFPATFWTIGMGQNAFLSSALLGGFALLVNRRPIAAGALLGALGFKPHLGLLAPVALIAGRRWAAFAAATATLSALIAASLLAFGWNTWKAYFTAMAGADQVYTTGRINFAGYASVFGAIRLMQYPTALAYAIQAIVTLLMGTLVLVVWRRNAPQPDRSAILLTATLLAVPLILLYDQFLAVVAIAVLLRNNRPDAFPLWEKLLLIACYPLALVAPILAVSRHVPLSAGVSLVVAAVCLRRAMQRNTR